MDALGVVVFHKDDLRMPGTAISGRGGVGDDADEVARQHLQCRVRSPDHATECNEDAAAVECRLDLGKDFRRDRMA